METARPVTRPRRLTGFAALKRSASDALGEANEVAEKVSKAARLADVMATARDAARSRSKTLAESVANAGAALANAATSAFAATRGSVAAFVGTRPAVVSSAQVASEAARADIDALAADAGATVDAVVGAVAKASEKEKAFAADERPEPPPPPPPPPPRCATPRTRRAPRRAPPRDCLRPRPRDGRGRGGRGCAPRVWHGESVAAPRCRAASAIETHVRRVDQGARRPCRRRTPSRAGVFHGAASTPCDAAVLAPCGAGVSVDEPSATNALSEGLADPADCRRTDERGGHGARPLGAASERTPPFSSRAANDENDAPARATKKSSSVAAMRARKLRGSAKPARPALRDVNH